MSDSDKLGDVDDSVTLKLGPHQVFVAERYDVRIGFYTQPSVFSLRLAHGRNHTIVEILKAVPPNTPFQMFIGGQLQQTGRTNCIGVDESEGSNILFDGSDRMASLHDAYCEDERSYTEETYFSLCQTVLKDHFLPKDPTTGERAKTPTDSFDLVGNNATNRKLMTGARRKLSKKEPNSEGAKIDGTPGGEPRHVRSRMGEKKYEFLKRHLDRAGLFFSCGASGEFVLASPNANQDPVARISRRRGQTRNEINVKLLEYRNSAKPPRYSEAIINARVGKRKFHRAITKGAFVDEEMEGWGIHRPLSVYDADVQTPEQAAFMARRKLAEGRRATWKLSYQSAGHTTAALGGGRCVWAPDTIVEVIDDELGINDLFWVESVEHQRIPHTVTNINLLRRGDLFFGIDT